ncbi:MAG: phosphate acyltransferase PlsX [Clostridiales bacterium]|nr:phosphate acyltransferase PlsX [Clostridiales bacterium]
MKIVIDCYGADYSPDELVKGAITSVNLIEDVEIILTGNQEEIQKVMDEVGYKGNKIEIVDAKDVISCNESPTMAIRRKKDSSLVAGLNILKDREDVIGMISAGSTGAVLAGGLFVIGRMDGVKRPALAPFLPTMTGGKTLLIDCGANVDCKPEYLQQFAIMGSIYVKSMLGIENPRVGLISNGVEEHKGNEQIHQTFELLKNTPEINFVGNMEAREMLSGDYDVLVCDGFTGNVALKSAEGTIKCFMEVLKQEIKAGGVRAKTGYLFMKKALKKIKARLNYTDVGGSPFLGINKILVKSHGSSKAKTIYSCVLQVMEIHKSNYIEKMREGIKNSSIAGEE